MHFFVTKRIYAYFFYRENDLCVFFVAKTIYAIRPESFCALVAIRKLQTFWASGLSEAHHLRANKNAEVDLPSDAFVKYSDKSLQTPNSIFVASLHM